MTQTDISIIVPCFNERANIQPLVTALHNALAAYNWEVIFVDDNSPDGTINKVRELAAHDPHVRGIRRIGRKGLSSAVIEGLLSSSASVVAVMDGDLQHDETCLPAMIKAIQDEHYDLVVASRHVEGGNSTGLAGNWRHFLSQSGIKLAQSFSVRLSDPMSGFFAMRREWFEASAQGLSGRGFKILLELVLNASETPRIKEVPMVFRKRIHGESKLGYTVMIQFLIMLGANLIKKPAVKRLKLPGAGLLTGCILLLCCRKNYKF